MSTLPSVAGLLSSKEVVNFAIAVEVAARASKISNPRFIEPAQGTLARARAPRHHIVFGRRGSGKTSLLAKAAADLTIDRQPIAFVDLETFKGHSYPDVLISVLIESLREFKKWFESAARSPASKASFWMRLFGSGPKRSPLDKRAVEKLIVELDKQIRVLESQLHVADASAISSTTESIQEANNQQSGKLGISAGPVSVGITESSGVRASHRSQVTESSRRSKIDFLHRNIIEYQRLFQAIADAADGNAFLFLDDLYHIRKADQPEVVDYFHRIAKGNRLWLKIGTIRHRTEWYRHSDPPTGLKLGDDADEIDLDLTLEKYSLTKDFLMKVLQGIGTEVGVDVRTLFAGTAIDRLVLASGGVARDFLALFRRSLDVARERVTRARGGGARGPRIGTQDVNQAAGEHDAAKRDELKRDTLDERTSVEGAFESVKAFCLGTANANCFLMEKDRSDPAAKLIEELVDLRLLHLAQSRVTISGRPGKLYVAFMLDLGQYTGERKRRGLELIPFWHAKATERLRRTRLIYDPPPSGVSPA